MLMESKGQQQNQAFGDVEALKRSIKNRYDSEIRDLKKRYEKEKRDIEEKIQREVKSIISEAKIAADREAAQERSRVFSEEKLKAKREFEEAREEVINRVFSEVRKEIPKVTHSPRYIAYLKKKKRELDLEKSQAFADGGYYEKVFPKWKKDAGIVGVRLLSEEAAYDFTLDSVLESKKEMLRMEISKALSMQEEAYQKDV
jgi:vacuolar-type H+-ATPase subunit E/Vma4